MLDGEELAGAAETGLDLVGDEHDSVAVAELTELAHEVDRRGDEAALAEDRLDDDRGHAVRGDLGLEEVAQVGKRRLGGPAPVGVRERRLVDLRRVRAEVLLVGVDAAGEAEGQQRAAVEAAPEADHGLAACCGSGDLDRVLDRLRAGGEKDRLLVPPDRGDLAQTLGEPQVGLVLDDLERRVGRSCELLLDRLHDAGVGVADVHHADASGEVDVALAADVPQLGASGPVGRDGVGAGDAAGHVPAPKLCELGLGR